MWVDYIEVHSIQSTIMGRSQHVGGLYRGSLSAVYNNEEISTCEEITEIKLLYDSQS